MDISKLQSNRKLIKVIDHFAITHASMMSLGYLLVYAYIAIMSSCIENYFKFSLIVLFALLALTALRFFVLLKPANFYATSPNRWRAILFTMSIIHVCVFSGFVFFGVLQLGESFYSWCLLLWVLGIAFLHGRIWKAHLQMNVLHQSFLLIPLLVICIKISSPTSLMAAGTIGLFFMLFIKFAELDYTSFWQRQLQTWQTKEKQRKLDFVEAKLAKIDEGKGEFLKDLSYELRTPMTGVMGMMTLLSDMGLNQHQQEFLQVAQRSGESLLSLIDEIIDFSCIASGTIVLDSNVFNLRECIDDLLETLGPLTNTKRLELCCLVDKNVPTRVRGDKIRISQILQTLICEMIANIEDEEIIISVHMQRISDAEGILHVNVQDQGKNIDSSVDRHAQLSSNFQKINVAGSPDTRTSLGLAICKGLVEAMNGQIGFISEPEKSTTLWFTAHLYLSTQQGQFFYHQELMGKHVLIFGASPGLVKMLHLELDYWQMTVEEIAENYDQVLQVLRNASRVKKPFDLLIINFGSGYQNALKLSKIVAEDPALAHCKQIFLTYLDQRRSQEVLNVYCKENQVPMVIKPVKQRIFQNALAEVFDLKNNTDARIFFPQTNVQSNNNFKILLVEDNDINQMVEKGMLNRLGFAAKVADNGLQAMKMLSQEHFDLIIMDCQMPSMDGYEAVSKIRQQESENNEHIPIIAITANLVSGEETKCLAVGMDDVLFKPFNIGELECKLRYWLLQGGSGSGGAHILLPSSIN